MLDVEQVAAWVYQITWSSPAQPPGPVALLQRVLGGDAVRMGPATRLLVRDGRYVVEIERDAPHPDVTSVRLGRILAQIVLEQSSPSPADVEIDRLAGALLMPAEAVRATIARVGPRADALAIAFVVPRCFVARRLTALGLSLSSGEYESASRIRTAG